MRRTIVDQLLSSNAGEVIVLDRATDHVHQWKLTPAAHQRVGVRLRVVVYEEPIDASPIDERVVEAARVELRTRLVPLLALVPGARLSDLRSLTDAVEDLVAARIGRALRIHCDADHDADA